MNLRGGTEIARLKIDSLLPTDDLLIYAKNSFHEKDCHYLKGNFFLLGRFCKIDGNDSYVVHVDNRDGAVYAVDVLE